ncbi:MAG: right-handed parallel beta-helix repeat-containing protein [Ignavibacteriales bacterium]|nr:right-handed parallel beta-helix repeat-containing protein [Ignavibacteriales bacterium]
MKMIYISIIMFLSILPAMTNNLLWAGSVIYVDGSNTGYEDGSKEHPYNTIQEGISASSDWGDTVQVATGAYYECVSIYKNLTLIGSGRNNTNIIATSIDSNTVSFTEGATSGTIIEKFKITSGKYGIYCGTYSYPTIKDNIISNNYRGVYCADHSNPDTIADNEISSNIDDGIFLKWHTSPLIKNNNINNNGECGIESDDSGATIDHNIITNNSIGVYHNWLKDMIITNNIIIDNSNYGIYCNNTYSDNPTITNNIISDNSIMLNFRSNPIYVNNTTVNCGISCRLSCYPIIMNNIIIEGFINTVNDSLPLIDYNNMWNSQYINCTAGPQDISADPLFVNPESNDYHISPNSPCIDAGNPEQQYNDPEDSANFGYALYPALGTVINDMGAYGGPGAANWCVMTNINPNHQELKKLIISYRLLYNYPNPFNYGTNIFFYLPKDEMVTLKVYDMLGHEVRTLMNEIKQAGTHKASFDALDLSSGLYLYRLETPSFTQSCKMLLIK